MSGDPLDRIARCANGSDETVNLTRGECVWILAVWTAANEVVAFHAPAVKDDEDVSRPLARLRMTVLAEDGAACEKCGHTAHEPGHCGVNVGTGYHGLVLCRCGLAEDGAA